MKHGAPGHETDLTPRQRETLNWVKCFIHEHGMPPTVREIGRAYDIKSSSVVYLLKTLDEGRYEYRAFRLHKNTTQDEGIRVRPAGGVEVLSGDTGAGVMLMKICSF